MTHNVNAWCVPFVTDSRSILLDARSVLGAYPPNAFGARFAVRKRSKGPFTYKTQCFGLKYDGNRMRQALDGIRLLNQQLAPGQEGSSRHRPGMQ